MNHFLECLELLLYFEIVLFSVILVDGFAGFQNDGGVVLGGKVAHVELKIKFIFLLIYNIIRSIKCGF